MAKVRRDRKNNKNSKYVMQTKLIGRRELELLKNALGLLRDPDRTTDPYSKCIKG